MKAQRHGNVSAMETCRRGQKIGSRCFFLVVIAMANLGLFGCGGNPPKDKNGNLPDDVVRNFIELCEAEKYEAARKLWYGPAMLPASVQRKFEDFCARYKRIGLKNCKILKAHKDKGVWRVHIHFEEEGKKKSVFFDLEIVDGEWRMERGYMW